LFDNIIKSSESDIVINYGINNYVSRIFIEDIKENLSEKIRQKNLEVEKLYFNANIHSSEDYIIKKIYKALDIDSDRTTFDKARTEIEEYYKNYKKNKSNKFLIIIYENIEHLFFKKKQTLFYTLLEIVNLSSNILFCGITANFNIMDMMEKRVRSRFSQKTIYLTLPDEEEFFYFLEDLFYSYANKNAVPIKKVNENPFLAKINDPIDIKELSKAKNFFKNKDILKIFYKKIVNINANFKEIFTNKINMGAGIKDIITQIKYLFTIFIVKFKTHLVKEPKEYTDENEIRYIFDLTVNQYRSENDSSYKNLLKSKIIYLFIYLLFNYLDFPKINILILICLYRCVIKLKDKITLPNIYNDYVEYKKSKKINTILDIIIIRKILEELANSNLIHIKSDEKYLNLYSLKYPTDETAEMIRDLNFSKSKDGLDKDKTKNIDSNMQGWLEFKDFR
jgi:hypothetical protein